MKQLKFVMPTLVLVIISVSSCFQQMGAKRINGPAGEIDLSQYKDYGAVVLLDYMAHSYTHVEEDKGAYYLQSWKTKVERKRKIKILSSEGLGEFGDFSSRFMDLQYDKYYVKIKTVSPEGQKKGYSKDDLLRIVSDAGYTQFKFAIPGLKIGSVIEIKETHETSMAPPYGLWNFGNTVPTIKSVLAFRVPFESIVRYHMYPEQEIVPVVGKESHYYDAYYFTVENVPPCAEEDYMPHALEGSPTLYYFVPLSGWKDVAEIYTRYFSDERWENKESADVYRSARADFINSMADIDVKGREDLVFEFLKKFRKEFKVNEFSGLFRSGINPEIAFTSKTGSPLQLAYVLRHYLLDLGFPSSVVLCKDATEGQLDRNLPGFADFSRVLVLVKTSDKDIWIDPQCASCQSGFLPAESQGALGLCINAVGKTGFITTPEHTPAENNMIETTEIFLQDGSDPLLKTEIKLAGQYQAETGTALGADLQPGSSIDTEKLEKTDGWLYDNVKTAIIDTESEITGVELLSIGDEGLVLSVSRAGHSSVLSGPGIIQINMASAVINRFFSTYRNMERKTDICYPTVFSNTVTTIINREKGWELVELPHSVELSNEFFAYNRQVSISDEKIVVTMQFQLTTRTIPANAYKEIRSDLINLSALDRQKILIELTK